MAQSSNTKLIYPKNKAKAKIIIRGTPEILSMLIAVIVSPVGISEMRVRSANLR